MTPNKKINILAIFPAFMPSTIIGVLKPLLALQRKGLLSCKFTHSVLFSPKKLKDIDLVVFCRNHEYSILQEVVSRKIPYIYDIDDNFFAIDINTTIGRYHRAIPSIYVLEKFITHATLVRTYSTPLANRCQQYNPNVLQLKSYFDFSLLKKKTTHAKTDAIKIVYATSRREDALQKVFNTALLAIAQEYPDTVQIYILGPKISDENLHALENVKSVKFQPNYNAFIDYFYNSEFDIGLAPMISDEFHDSKTNNKYREYGACGIAGIYSNTPIYRSCIHNMENGILVDNDYDSWFNAIEKLILDNQLIQKIKRNANDDVKQNYSFEATLTDWEHCIENAMHVESKNADIHEYCIAMLTEFSSVNNSALLLKNWLTPIHRFYKFRHETAYNKGFRNFIINLSFESVTDFHKFEFKSDAKYLIVFYDYLTESLIEQYKDKKNILFYQGGKRVMLDDKHYQLSIEHQYDPVENNFFFAEFKTICDEFFIHDHITFSLLEKIKRFLRRTKALIRVLCNKRSLLQILTVMISQVRANWLKRY